MGERLSDRLSLRNCCLAIAWASFYHKCPPSFPDSSFSWPFGCSFRSLYYLSSKAVHALALVYGLYTAVVFNLPYAFPLSTDNFNYSPIGIGSVAAIFIGWWFADARRWFRGPRYARRTAQQHQEESAGLEGSRDTDEDDSVHSGEAVGMSRIFR